MSRDPEKVRERQRKYYDANREKMLEYQRKYRAANREKVLGRKRKYYAANREKMLERARKYYAANREKEQERARARQTAQRRWLSALKLSAGCADCGYRDHPAALDFDHLDSATKLFAIGERVSMSPARLSEEIAKCEVVCANCHRVRTESRRAA